MNERKTTIDNKYVIDRLIGVGGVASVYKAWDTMLHKFVAVKKVHEKFSKDARFVDMFRNEAINTAKLEHENIVRVVNFIKEDNDFYMVMDFVNGVDLEYLLNKCRKNKIKIPSHISVYIIGEVIKALDYAHNLKDENTGERLALVHRDISPGNIMLHYDGRIKLTDFGIAKAGEAAPEDDKIKGKISYMSSEQARCKEVDGRSDLFCCGLVLYEMLTGTKPYKGSSDMEIWKKAKDAKVDLKKLQAKGVDDDLISVLKRLLKKDPGARHQSAAELFIDFKRYLSRSGSTSEMSEKYRKFIGSLLKEEITAAEEEAKEKSKIDYIPSEKPQPEPDKEKQKSSPDPAEKETEESPEKKPAAAYDSKDKTLLDFVVDSANKYKKLFITSLLSVSAAFIIFLVIDIFARLTPMGVGIHSRIWPPDLIINTSPPGAAISITDERGRDIIQEYGYSDVTPSHIERLPPGTYTLSAEKEGFRGISRLVTVAGDDRDLVSQVTIAGARIEDQVHIVPFEVGVSIDSYPGDAVIRINGRNVGRTPYSEHLESGKYSLKLEKEGFEVLGMSEIPDDIRPGVCVIDVTQHADEQWLVDRRFWDIREEEHNGVRSLSVTGTPWKDILIESVPGEARIFISDEETGEEQEAGVTPASGLMLTAGRYSLRLEKEGHRSWDGEFTVDAETEDTLHVYLDKYVTVNAVDSISRRSINADIVISGPSMDTIRGKTPIRAALPPEEISFTLSNEPAYEPVRLSYDITRVGDSISIEMEKRPPHLTLSVKDYRSGEGVESTVWINGVYWRRTDSSGEARGSIDEPPGEYKVEVRSDDYDDYRTRATIESGQRKQLEVRLGAPKDGSAKMVYPEEFTLKTVTLDDETVTPGPGSVITGIPRGYNTLEAEFGEPEGKVSHVFSISEPRESFIFTISRERGRFLLKEESPPEIRVSVSDSETGEPVKGASLWLGDEKLGETDESGEVFSRLLKSEGEYLLRVTGEDIEESESPVELAYGRRKEKNIEVGVIRN